MAVILKKMCQRWCIVKTLTQLFFNIRSLSCYFELLWPQIKLPLNRKKPGNKCVLGKKNIKEIMIHHKGTRMVKDGEDQHGLQSTNVKNLS